MTDFTTVVTLGILSDLGCGLPGLLGLTFDVSLGVGIGVRSRIRGFLGSL